MKYTELNSKVWDAWNENGIEWSIPITHEQYEQAKLGKWEVCLTTIKPVPRDWFPVITGAKILGLASAGGQQMPIFKALGASVTIFDYSEKQLQCESFVAEREGYDINIVKGDMTNPLPFEDGSFDMIFHPVSNVYVEDVLPIWRECSRVLKKGGLLLAGMANPIVFMFSNKDALQVVNKLPFNPLNSLSNEQISQAAENNEGLLFSHSLTELIDGQLQAGLTITNFYEDYNKENWHPIGDYTPTYFATRAIKV